MKQPDQPNFFDIRTIIAIVVMGVTFIGWQAYLKKKYPDYGKKAEASAPATAGESAPAATGTVTADPQTGAPVANSAADKPGATLTASTSAPETMTPYKSETLEFEISSKGMGLKNIRIPKYKDRNGGIVELGHTETGVLPLETRLLGRTDAVDFTIEKVNDNLFVGRAKVGGLQLVKAMEIDPEKYVLKYKVSASGADPKFVGLTTALTEQITHTGGGSFFAPQTEFQEFYLDTADTHERTHFHKEDETKSWNKVRVASIGSQYFATALLDKSNVMPEAKSSLNHKDKLAQIILQYPVLNPGQDFSLEYDAFVGPKSFNLLNAIDPMLAKIVDFGHYTSWFARQIFKLLTFLQSHIGNWGLAIIALTLLVRLLVLPFNVYSYKSMRKMQVIQPQIQSLKERYKDDQQKQQAEMMKLMRENKVNPVGGCLPILLQFPIFVALYQVLGHSVELYQANFGLWIHDLSLKDPYYILPVLMGVTMFIQQKTTPNATMDPAQAKVLLMMPVVFTFFMLALPSGLTLYMWVGALFSVAQQLYFMKTHPVEVK